jgi:hypothetical protein
MDVAVENANVRGNWRFAAGETTVANTGAVADSPTAVAEGPLFDDATARAVSEWHTRVTDGNRKRTASLHLTWLTLERVGLAEWARASMQSPPTCTIRYCGDVLRCKPTRAIDEGATVEVWFEEVAEGPAGEGR